MRAVRVVSVSALAFACVTCAEQPLVKTVGYARVPLAPSFVTAPVGGPNIAIERIRGVLHGSTDSTVAEGLVEGDSAILEFQQVVVQGDSSSYTLNVYALDSNNVVIFEGEEPLQVKPGDNAPATPTLEYIAPDAVAASIDISVTALALDYAGASTAPNACLNKIPNASAITQQQLTVTGKTAANVTVPNVHVGWTSRNPNAFTVDSTGKVKAGCANLSAWLVARTFLDKSDSILVTVTAPPFSLKMSPDSSDVARFEAGQLTALVVDETNNAVPAASVTWFSSDTNRAKVSATGLVTGVGQGRVLITAASGNRTTVGVIRVVRPRAKKVILQPIVALDSLGLGQSRTYFAKALDQTNKVIPDASGFVWSTSSSAITIGASTGVATAVTAGGPKVFIKVALEDGRDSIADTVVTLMPAGSIKGKVTDAATGLALLGVDVRSSPSNVVTTDAQGAFTLGGLQSGDSLMLTKSGYVAIVASNMPVFPNKIIEVPGVPMSPSGGGSGSFTGKTINAVFNTVVGGISVKAYPGVNSAPTPQRPNTPAGTTTTASDGTYTLSGLNPGVYTVIYSATGYSDVTGGANVVGGQTKTVNDVLMPPAAIGGGLYIVLTWGDCSVTNVPCDLNAHLTGPKVIPDTVPPRFQLYAGNRRYMAGGDTVANVDVTDANSRGPEIISIRPAAPAGTYKYYVHNASLGTGSNMALADSAFARVDVFQDNRLIGTFFPPSNVSGNVWNVFDYDGARLIPVGTITNDATPTDQNLKALPATRRKQ